MVGVLAALGTVAAIAQQPGGPGPGGPGGARPPLIAALDADDDGVISAEELKAATDALSKLDKNKDGKLQKDEVPEPLWDKLSNADTNKDGAVTADEIKQSLELLRRYL